MGICASQVQSVYVIELSERPMWGDVPLQLSKENNSSNAPRRRSSLGATAMSQQLTQSHNNNSNNNAATPPMIVRRSTVGTASASTGGLGGGEITPPGGRPSAALLKVSVSSSLPWLIKDVNYVTNYCSLQSFISICCLLLINSAYNGRFANLNIGIYPSIRSTFTSRYSNTGYWTYGHGEAV